MADNHSESSESNETTPGESFDMYSEPVKRRIGAVRKLHLDWKKENDKHQTELKALRQKYDALFKDIFMKQEQIIAGEHEPLDAELAPPDAIGVTEEECKVTQSSVSG